MKRPNDLTSKLKVADTEIHNYVVALEAENLKLQKQIAKLEVENVSQQHKIVALKKMQPQARIVIKGLYDNKKKNQTDGV